MTLENVIQFSTLSNSITTTMALQQQQQQQQQQQTNDYKCFNCQIPCVRGDPSLIRAMSNLYHKSCFTCHSCQISVLDKFYVMDSSISSSTTRNNHHIILCEQDYHRYHHQTRVKCHQCNQPINNNDYQLIGIYKYHKYCLHCPGCIITQCLPITTPSSSCSTSLSSIITSNDEQQQQPPAEEFLQDDNEDSLERFNYNNRPYCRYHYSLIKGTECTGCRQTVLYEQQQSTTITNKWHPECYNLMKYYQVKLADLFSLKPSDIQSKTQLFTLQNKYQHIIGKIWEKPSQFEDATFKIISNIVSLQQQSTNSKILFEACQSLDTQVNILFSVLDLVFKYFTHLSIDSVIEKFSNQLIHFLDTICRQEASMGTSNGTDDKLEMKFVNILLQSTRDLVKLSLQQTILLERNFGVQDHSLIDQVIRIYSNNLAVKKKKSMNVSCLDHYLQSIDTSMTRLAFVLNITPFQQTEQQGQQQSVTAASDETILFKPTLLMTKPTLYPLSTFNQQQKNIRMIHQQQPTYLTKSSTTTDIYSASSTFVPTTTDLKRSKSITSRNPSINYSLSSLATTPTTTSSSSSSSFVHITPTNSSTMEPTSKNTTANRMDSIRRALTTTRSNSSSSSKKENILNRSHSIFSNSSNRSVHTPPLYISLPDVAQLNHHHYNNKTPPLSPLSNNQSFGTYLTDLTQQQSCISRHMAILYIESEDAGEGDLLSLLSDESTKKSLWGKLRTHILTPSATEPANPLNNTTTLGEKKIGVSLSQNTSSGSLTGSTLYYKIPDHCQEQFENWKAHCPSVPACFSPNSCAPNFLKDCILAMIDQNINMEGVFRKNGNIRQLKETCDQLDENAQESWFDFFRQQHIIQLAAFLKRYLRELPEPLLTYKLHKLFLMSSSNPTMIHYVICMLPKINRDILLLILALLNWVARHAQDNKMDFENLARVMTPNILYNDKKASGGSVDVTQCHHEIRIVALMIEHYDVFVKVPNEFNVLLEHPKMTQYVFNNSIDLTCFKQFTKSYSHLTRLKKEIFADDNPSNTPPTPSTSSIL